MQTPRISPACLVLAGVLVLDGVWVTSPALADRRSFTRTYEYLTMTEGDTELELYTTQSRARWEAPSPQAFELQLAVEHGITERWDVSLFHVFEQTRGTGAIDGEPFHFADLALRTRYRISERGELPVDLLISGQVGKTFGEGLYQGELRVALVRDLDRLSLAINPIATVVAGPSLDEPQVIAGWAAGLTFEALPEIEVGAESWGEQ